MIKPLQQRATEKNCVNNEGVKNWQPSNIKVGRQEENKKNFTDQILALGLSFWVKRCSS